MRHTVVKRDEYSCCTCSKYIDSMGKVLQKSSDVYRITISITHHYHIASHTQTTPGQATSEKYLIQVTEHSDLDLLVSYSRDYGIDK